MVKEKLQYYDVLMIGIGYILGAGIYALLGIVSKYSGNMLWLSILITGMFSLLTSYSYIKLSSKSSDTALEYNLLEKSFGYIPSTIIMVLSVISIIFSCATISLGFGYYLENLTGLSPLIGASIAIATTCYINIIGLRETVNVNAIMTIMEVFGLIIIIVAGLGKWNYKTLTTMPPGKMPSILYGSYLFTFAFFGFETLIRLSEETEDSDVNIPSAIKNSIIITMILYMLVGLSAISLIGYKDLSKSKAPLADVIRIINIPHLAQGISIIALGSAYNTILTSLLTNSRLLHSLVNKDIIKIPLVNKYIKEKNSNNIPVNSVIINGLLSFIVMILIHNIEKTTFISNIGIIILLIAVNIAYFTSS